MKKNILFLFKASGLVLLAFLFLPKLNAQQLRSLSGANSPNDDTNPVWIGGNTLLFTRAFHPSNLGGATDPGDIWMTQKGKTGDWEEATHRPDLSSKGYDLALGLEDVLTLLILRSEGGKWSLHQYSKFGLDWNYLREVSFPGLSSFEGTINGRVVSGGKFMFLSGKRKDGYGNEDLYISEKSGLNQWSEPLNLGPVVNGFGQEMGPFYDPETRQLYYSSNSHPGANGKDILISKRLGDDWQSWSMPEKWEQISSRGSEASITFLSKEEVVWTSTQNSDGYADLMTFSTIVPLVIPTEFVAPATTPTQQAAVTKIEPPKPAPVVEEKPKVVVAQSSDTSSVILSQPKVIPVQPKQPEVKSVQPVQPEVPAKPMVVSTQPVINEASIIWLVKDSQSGLELTSSVEYYSGTQIVDFRGEILASKLKGAGVDFLKFSSDGYFPKLVSLESFSSSTINEVLLTKALPGSTILLENVNFKRGTAELEGEATESSLTDLAVFLVGNPQIKIRVNGHTDNLGDPGLNKKLSLERAGSVRDFLVSKGVKFENLRISGWGGTRPIASNSTEEGRAKNRRVELGVEN